MCYSVDRSAGLQEVAVIDQVAALYYKVSIIPRFDCNSRLGHAADQI